jgi:hypothetical protein
MKLQFSCQSVVCTLEPFAERRKCANTRPSLRRKRPEKWALALPRVSANRLL